MKLPLIAAAALLALAGIAPEAGAQVFGQLSPAQPIDLNTVSPFQLAALQQPQPLLPALVQQWLSMRADRSSESSGSMDVEQRRSTAETVSPVSSLDNRLRTDSC